MSPDMSLSRGSGLELTGAIGGEESRLHRSLQATRPPPPGYSTPPPAPPTRPPRPGQPEPEPEPVASAVPTRPPRPVPVPTNPLPEPEPLAVPLPPPPPPPTPPPPPLPVPEPEPPPLQEPCELGGNCGGQARTACGSMCPLVCGEATPGMCNMNCFTGFQCPGQTSFDRPSGACIPIADCSGSSEGGGPPRPGRPGGGGGGGLDGENAGGIRYEPPSSPALKRAAGACAAFVLVIIS